MWEKHKAEDLYYPVQEDVSPKITKIAFPGKLDTPQVQRIYLDELGAAAENSLQLAIVQLIIEGEDTAVDRGRDLILQARQELADAGQTHLKLTKINGQKPLFMYLTQK